MLISNLIITWHCCPPKMTQYFPFNIIHNWHLFLPMDLSPKEKGNKQKKRKLIPNLNIIIQEN